MRASVECTGVNQRQAPVHDARSCRRFRDEACANDSRKSEGEVGHAGGKDGNDAVDTHRRSSALERRSGGRGESASGSNAGAVSGVGRRTVTSASGDGGRDGRGLNGDGAGRSARHGHGVDAVDSRGDVDSGVVRSVLLRIREGKERGEKEDNELLEGAHGDVCCCIVGWCSV